MANCENALDDLCEISGSALRHVSCKRASPLVQISVRRQCEICCSFGRSPSGEGRRSDLVRSSSYGGALLKCESVNLTLQVQHKETVSPNRVSLCLRVCFGSCFSVLTQTLESAVCMCKRGG